MARSWTWTETDAAISEPIRAWLPERVFDIHAHLYRTADLTLAKASLFAEGPPAVTIEVWREHTERQLGAGRVVGGLFFPMPLAKPDQVDANNAFLVDQLKGAPQSRGLLLVHPESCRDRIAEALAGDVVAGFKVYHTYSRDRPTFEASPASFLPEWAWQLADAHRSVITLHIVKRRALADPGNQAYLRDRCRRYPGAKLILAHAARGFHAHHTPLGLPALRGLDNVWFDTSGICEPLALTAILEAFGPSKLVWGSDFPVSEIRGKCVSVGDGFAWLDSDNVRWSRMSPACEPTLVGLESLRAIRQSVDEVGLNRADVEDLFCNNALRLLGLAAETGCRTDQLYQHGRRRIPGGTQLLSKRPERLAPGRWPAYFREARGCEVWDLDGRHYFDLSTSGIGSCLLGFRDPDVTRAVRRRIQLGSMCTLNPPEEVALADRLCEIHPWAEQVRFTRAGGEAVAVAVRIARATTGRSLVAVCGYHGWHDWYLAANLGAADALDLLLLPGLQPVGVPVELLGTTRAFHFNDADEFQQVIEQCGDRLAAVVMEPARTEAPQNGFLEQIRRETRRLGALLVFDEISIGWRLCYGGAHLQFGTDPDIAVFAKAIGNGHPMGAVIGTRPAMAGAHDAFISSTYWTEGVGPVAALATLEKMRQVDVPRHIARVGTTIAAAWQSLGEKHGLPVVAGETFACFASFRFEHPLAAELRTLYTQLMLDRGLLAGPIIYPSLAHTDDVVERYTTAVDEVFGEMARALDAGQVRERLSGPVAESGFGRLT